MQFLAGEPVPHVFVPPAEDDPLPPFLQQRRSVETGARFSKWKAEDDQPSTDPEKLGDRLGPPRPGYMFKRVHRDDRVEGFVSERQMRRRTSYRDEPGWNLLPITIREFNIDPHDTPAEEVSEPDTTTPYVKDPRVLVRNHRRDGRNDGAVAHPGVET